MTGNVPDLRISHHFNPLAQGHRRQLELRVSESLELLDALNALVWSTLR